MRVDEIYIDTAKKIITEGFNEKNSGTDVRPTWTDGQAAHAIYLPQVVTRYEEGVTPIISIRKIAWKTAIKEILWIYQDKSNDVNLLKEKYNVHYWDSWANEDGNLGTAYGYQVAKEFISPETGKLTNQIDRLIENIKSAPLNRRHFTTLLNLEDLSTMTLIPCAFMTLWTVVEDRLNMTLIQRSGDFLAAAAPGGINAFQYYALLLMVCKCTGYKPGEFVHFVQNLHIYERHLDMVKKVIDFDYKNLPIPELKIIGDKKDFNSFTIDDFVMENYEPDDSKYDIEIAI